MGFMISEDGKLCDMKMALARMGGNAELLKQAMELIRADLPDVLNQLRSGVAAGNAVVVERAAHSMQGMVVTFDAEAALIAARRLEQMGQARDLSTAAGAMQDLERQIDRLDKELTAELQKG